MASKDLLVINKNIISKIINQVYVEQKKLFTKKNYLKAKNDNKIYLDFKDNMIDVILELNEEYVIDKTVFVEIIDFEIKNIIENSTNYRINKLDINFNTNKQKSQDSQNSLILTIESVDKHPVLNLKDFIVGKVGTNIDIYPVFVNTFLLIN